MIRSLLANWIQELRERTVDGMIAALDFLGERTRIFSAGLNVF